MSLSTGTSLAGLVVDLDAIERLSPAEREAVAVELRQVEDAAKQNPLLVYRPHPKQAVFHRPPFPRSRLFLGGNRSGKTTATMVDTIIQAIDRDVVPDHLLAYKRWEPPFYGRVITPDLTNTLEGVVLQKFREWTPRKEFKGGSFDRAWDKQLRVLHFKNGSWIQFFSNDQDLDKFGGAALHRVVYDEEPRADIRRECLMRLIDYGGEELFGMTPLHGMSWVYDEFFEPWEREALSPDGVRLVIVDMDDNPHLDEDTKEWVLSGLGEEERQARKSGRFVAFAGLIYSQFQVSRHVIPALGELPRDIAIECFRGIDPGIRHMCAVLYAYLDQDDDLVIFDEIPALDVTIRQVCEEMKRRDLRWGRKTPDGIVPLSSAWSVIDPASRNRNNQTGRSDQAEFMEHGIVTIPAQNAVTPGINRVKERLDADRLKVCANCTVTISEFKKYRWTRETSRSESDARETPVKKDDHLLDALRYVVMQRPLVPDRDRAKPTDTMKDRLLRASLRALAGRARPDHPAGPGIYA